MTATTSTTAAHPWGLPSRERHLNDQARMNNGTRITPALVELMVIVRGLANPSERKISSASERT